MAEPEDFGVRDRPHVSIEWSSRNRGLQLPGASAGAQAAAGGLRRARRMALLDQLASALGDLPPAGADPRLRVEGLKPGTVVEVSTLPPAEGSRARAVKVPAALEFPNQDVVVLRSERHEDRTESALLFVPDDARAFLRGRIADYGRDPGNARRPDVERFEAIETVRAAPVSALFVGDVDLAASGHRLVGAVGSGRRRARGTPVGARARGQPRCSCRPARLSRTRQSCSSTPRAGTSGVFAARVPGAIAEIRRATGTIEPFLDRGEGRTGQHDWVAELAARVVPPGADAPVVCVLDTGVSAEHPLARARPPRRLGLRRGVGHARPRTRTVDTGRDRRPGALWRPRAADERDAAGRADPRRRVDEAPAAARLPPDATAELWRRDARRRRAGRSRAAECSAELLPGNFGDRLPAEPAVELERRAGPDRRRRHARRCGGKAFRPPKVRSGSCWWRPATCRAA